MLRRQLIMEHVVAPRTPPDLVRQLIQDMINEIAVSDELIIVDPYFFPSSADANYVTSIESVLTSTVARLQTLHIVTHRKFDSNAKQKIEAMLANRNPQLSVQHAVTDSFHDRFWINRKAVKGFLMGSSFNGLAKKYAVVDRLEDADVAKIVSALLAEALI